MGFYLHPFSAAGNDREHLPLCSHDPHIVLQLGHMLSVADAAKDDKIDNMSIISMALSCGRLGSPDIRG